MGFWKLGVTGIYYAGFKGLNEGARVYLQNWLLFLQVPPLNTYLFSASELIILFLIDLNGTVQPILLMNTLNFLQIFELAFTRCG